jgi:hypothetical protein
MNSVVPWTIIEIVLTSLVAYDSPYTQIDVDVVFTGPNGQTIVRPAFWDGGNTWRVRFAAPAVGEWRWQSTCSDRTNAGLHGQTGVLQCVPGEGKTAIAKHGFLRISENRRHFVHADGTPFFWLGDTHWQMPDTERVDACNHPDHRGKSCPFGGQFQHVVADRKARGFNVYQTYPQPNSDHWWTRKYDALNPERFRTVFDFQMDHLAAEGFVIALGVSHFHNSTRIDVADLRRWTRYLVARYGAHPVVWITCQEMNAPAHSGGKPFNRIEVWREVARVIEANDGYKHPHSGHQWVLDVTTSPLGQEPWHDWFALQGGHLNSGLTPQKRYKGYYDFTPTRPMIETEAMYERVDCGGVASADDARRSAWKAMLCGSAGYTYGAGGVWALKWDKDDPRFKSYNAPIDAWHTGIALKSADQMTILKDFFVSLPWTQLTPRFDDPEWATWNDPERCVLATDGNRRYIAYFYGDSSSGTLKGLDRTARYRATWFDPRTGKTKSLPAVRAASGQWAVPEKPTREDWVLHLEIVQPN